MQRKFLKCCECGNIIVSSNNNLSCCDKKMFELVPNKTDAATEKHIPKLVLKDQVANISIGEVIHPMLEEHYIAWVYIFTNKRSIKYDLKPNHEPIIMLSLSENEEIKEIYAYCNTHGLWVKTI